MQASADQNPLSQHFSLPSLLRFALPSIAMMLCMGLYTMVDTLFVARYVNTHALSAVNICTPVLYLVVGLAGMLSTGASAIIGRKLGHGDALGACQTFTFVTLFTVLSALALSTFGMLQRDELMAFLGAQDELLPYVWQYLRPQLLFLPANMLSCLFQNLFVVGGRPSLGLIVSLLSGLVNVALDSLFLIHLGWGVAGASLATGCSYLLPALGGMVFFARQNGYLRFRRPVWKPRELWESCGNGMSEMVGQSATAVTTFFFNHIMLELAGVEGVAAVTILLYSQFLCNALFIGFSMGTAPLFSYNHGSGNAKETRNLYRLCMGVLTVSSLGMFIIVQASAPALSGLFVDTTSSVYGMVLRGYTFFAVSFLFSGFNLFASALFTALANGRLSALLSFLRTFGFLLTALLVLPRLLGERGVWLAVPLAEGLCFFLSFALLRHKRHVYAFG